VSFTLLLKQRLLISMSAANKLIAIILKVARVFRSMNNVFSFFPALESLGFGSYITEVKEVLQECKTVALKRRKASSRLENLGIPEEELLRQQQELFAKARQQQAELAQQEWLQMQQAAQQAQLAAASASASNQAGSSQDEDDEDDI
uniref:Down-regulator of transcription 1 n=1 Tax=Dromaius novaehollandiae TaxID=8790 RepID=A0A8C4IWG3_DRONO